MFEGIVSTVLTRVLGDYIEDIDKKSLNISVWSGTINLKDLRLKKATFDSLTVDLPISVVHGYVGTIDAKIPWSSLGSVPVVATIKDVFIVVQPKKCVQWDEKLAQNTKKNALNPKEPSASQDSSFISHLVEKIVNNLQLTLENVHIRYEGTKVAFYH
jgi:vacuolar protein sorting-associated protein 13A/C